MGRRQGWGPTRRLSIAERLELRPCAFPWDQSPLVSVG